MRDDVRTLGLCGVVAAVSCLDRPLVNVPPQLQLGFGASIVRADVKLDLLFVVDNSNSMAGNQIVMARDFHSLLDPLLRANGSDGVPVTDLHVGVISTDLGAGPLGQSPCVNTSFGDDGVLNPVRVPTLAMGMHAPWQGSSALPAEYDGSTGMARCQSRPDQYRAFLSYTSGGDQRYREAFQQDFVCTAFLNDRGCNTEQPLEAAYRALIDRPRHTTGGVDSLNDGFLREDAVLAIIVITDEEDSSVRDARYPERDTNGRERTVSSDQSDALSVFDPAVTRWGPNFALMGGIYFENRFYRYAPGTDNDPTWPIARYIDLNDLTRGFPGLKPGHPERVIFGAIGGFPLEIPRVGTGRYPPVDWARLLGSNPDQSDAWRSAPKDPLGPMSMRLGPDAPSEDPACMPPRVVLPACRRPGPRAMRSDTCWPEQYFALPSRRIAQVAQQFDLGYTRHLGLSRPTLHSICDESYNSVFVELARRIQNRLTGRCLLRQEYPTPRGCTENESPAATCDESVRAVHCEVRESMPRNVHCDATHGRRRVGTTADGREVCLVDQVPVAFARPPEPGAGRGFYYDTTYDPDNAECWPRLSYTEGDGPGQAVTADLLCVQENETDASVED